MPPKVEKHPPIIDIVEIDSDDDEGPTITTTTTTRNATTTTTTTTYHQTTPLPDRKPPPHQQQHSYQNLASRCFWKAGDYVVGPTARASPLQGHLEHARVHPKFLHSNATSHKWAFGAIAELLDNAVDEIQSGATFVKVDKIDIMKDNSPALLFQDDGGGMDPEGIRKCMSLGYSSKKSNTTIGQYGNGFKTSTMRLGADVIVLSRANHAGKATQSAGLLSYSFLRQTGQDDIIVPMVDFDISGHWVEPIIYSTQDDWSSNLKTILEWSPFKSKEELLEQFEHIGHHGTRIIIFNLWLNDEGIYELSFDDDDEDIQLRDEANRGGQTKVHKKTAEYRSHISYRLCYSLRAYASILYLRKFRNFKIILRGKPVQQYNIADDLQYPKVVKYNPQSAPGLTEVTVVTTLGFVKEVPVLNVCGFNIYNKNRLIKPFWKVNGDGNQRGNGVVGSLEANFIEPAHDKQDFERSSAFLRLEAKLKKIQMEYWKTHRMLVGIGDPAPPPGFSNANAQKEPKAEAQKPMSRHSVGPTYNGGEKRSDFLHANLSHDSRQQGLSSEVIVDDGTGLPSVEQLCEENIELFRRCEEHRQQELELKKTVEELEKELEQARRKYDQLAAHLETKRKQQNLQQQLEKVLQR